MSAPTPAFALTIADLTATLKRVAAGPHSLNRLADLALTLPASEPTRAEIEAELHHAPPFPERWARIDEQMAIEAEDLRAIEDELPEERPASEAEP